MQVTRQIQLALQRLLRLAQMEGCLNDFVEQGLLPVVSAQFHETSRSTDMRMLVVLETLCGACVASGETFRRIETKVTKPLLHIVGNYPNATVQLHAAYCLRCIGHGSPPQLFQLLSVLLNLSTVQNAEVLGTPLRRKDANGQMVAGDTAVAAAAAHADLQPLVRGLFGYCAALAAMSSELYSSELGVPHDVTSAVLGTSGALLQAHPSCAISAQRRCCAFLLLEGLMCLGSDWVGQRLTTLFALWKTALGKKPVDRAKVVYQEHVASSSSKSSSSDADNSANVCRDELLSLLFALRSLYAFTWHSKDTLLTTLPHLHKILVVFLTNISQLVVGLPHPTSTSFRAKYRQEASQPGAMRPIITMAGQCGIPEILLMIRATMYRTFAAMQPSLYSSRFVPLLNMLADDVTRVLPQDFPVTEIITELAGRTMDSVLDLVDSHLETSRDCPSTARLAVKKLLSCGAQGIQGQDAAPFAEDLGSDAGAACIFNILNRESPGGTDCMLIPWDAWVDSTQPLAGQCVSAEWDWRCSSVKLLSMIINAPEVGEAPRAVVLQHLLKKKETSDEANQSTERYSMAAVAVLAYLREHAHLRGLRVAPPQQAIEQALDLSLAGLKESNPILRRLHAEILAMLFFCHHQLPDSPVVPKILQHLAADSPQSSDPKDVKTEEKLKERSAVALLCGSILRAFAWGWSMLPPGGRGFHCPYIMNIVPILLKLAKETAQPVRLWMLYSLYISMEAAGTAFAPFMKDALRLATAHLLADFFEAPLVLWVVSELTHAAAIILHKNDTAECEGREDHLLSGIWKVIQQIQHVQHGGNAFATVRAEAVCLNTAPYLSRLIPADNLPKLAAKKLCGDESGSQVCTVRTFASQCLCQLANSGADLLGLFPDRTQLFQLLDASKGAEAEALQDLILAMLRGNGLAQLPTWLQALRQVVLALSKNSKEELTNLNRKGSEDRMADEVDDEASFADPKQDLNTKQKFSSCTATKVFAVSCVQLLLEQVPAKDSVHFQPDVSSPSSELPMEKRFITHLDLLVGIAVNAASSDEVSLSAAGLRLMLLVVGRFQHTKDVQGQVEGVDCPLLLVQFEAQMTTCIRHNLRASANPSVVRLALELLRDVIAVRACTSTHRLIALLMQPLSSQTFEPDPLFSEAASTGCFLFRLRCACAVLDSGQSQEQAAVAAYSKHLSRWIENALRDSAVLLAGLPLQSVKSYQPTCFSFADYKAIQPLFREAVPSLLRGICVLGAEEPIAKKSSPTALQPKSSPSALSKDLVSLSLGVVMTLLADASIDDVLVFLSTIRHMLILSAQSSEDDGAVVSLGTFMDVLGCVWREVYCKRRCKALMNLMELFHGISGVLWKAKVSQQKSEALELPWLEGLCSEGESSRTVLGTYAFHIVAATMNRADVSESHLTMALEVFQWWLQDALSQTLSDSEAESREDEELNKLMDQALAEDNEDECVAPAGETCPWFWLLLKPLPETLVQSHPAVTLKHWKQICTLLSSPAATTASALCKQLLRLVLISNTLCASVIQKLGAPLVTDASERQLVYSFATLVPAVTAMAAVLQAAHEGSTQEQTAEGAEQASATAQKCLDHLKELFDMAWAHPSVKVVQAAVSSAQNLLQNPACLDLCRVIVPGLVDAIATEPPKIALPAMEHAWGIFPTLLAAQSQTGDAKLVKSSTQLLLQLVCTVAEFAKPTGAGQTAMANCLMQAAQIEPSLKAEIVNMPAESQRTVQELLRAHVNARVDSSAAGNIPRVPLAHKKIELKLKF